MTSTLPVGTLPDRWIDEGERRDWTTVFAVLFVLAVGLVTSAWPVLLMLLSMVPPDSCDPGSCGGGVTGMTVVLAAGLLAELGLFVATTLLSRRRQRAMRWMCAVAAPVMPLIGLAALFA
ncbi:hypothetical protein [Yinghuangia sp. YIM S09857]|uniref:hypothetical protein n=1 Tax=Yinghuangia sp. YIM S09857 TaxID=3436929 RepID=UPI003F52D513